MKQSTFIALAVIVLLRLFFPVGATYPQPIIGTPLPDATPTDAGPTEVPTIAYPAPETPVATEAYPVPSIDQTQSIDTYPAPDGPTPGQGGIEWFGATKPKSESQQDSTPERQVAPNVSWIARASWTFLQVIRTANLR